MICFLSFEYAVTCTPNGQKRNSSCTPCHLLPNYSKGMANVAEDYFIFHLLDDQTESTKRKVYYRYMLSKIVSNVQQIIKLQWPS